MIIREFPDFTLRDHDFDAPCPLYGFPNAFILAEDRELHYPDHSGPLTILCNFRGSGEYLVGNRRYVVDDASYLVLNRGQRFSNTIRSQSPVESFHVWFQPGFAEEVLRDLVLPSDRLLDDPERDTDRPLLFIEKIYQHDTTLTPMLMEARARIASGVITMGWQEEQFHRLLEHLLQVHRNVARDIEKLPAVRRSTRTEIYKRLHAAKEFIDGSIGEEITLLQMARAACMSVHHFLRLFKAAFGETPHQYLTGRRIERARALLVDSTLTISEVCAAVGFQSPGSFSWLFRRHVGRSPEGYRDYHRNPSQHSDTTSPL